MINHLSSLITKLTVSMLLTSPLYAGAILFNGTQSWDTTYIGDNVWKENRTNIEFFDFAVINDSFIDFTIRPTSIALSAHFEPNFRLFSERISETTGMYRSLYDSFSTRVFLTSGSYLIGVTSGPSLYDDYIVDGFVQLWGREVSTPKSDVNYRLKIQGDIARIDEPGSIVLLSIGLLVFPWCQTPAKRRWCQTPNIS